MGYMKDATGRRLDSFSVASASTTNRAVGPWRGVPVANEAAWADGQWTNVYACNSRKRYISNRATGLVRLVYAAVAGANDTIPTQPFVVRASIEAVAGTFQRVLFSGRREGVVAPGGMLVSDPVYANIAAGQQFWITTHAAGPALFTFGPIMGTQSAWGEGCDAGFDAATTDKTLSGSGSVGTNNNFAHVSPVAVIGDAGDGLPFVCLTGDSIMAGLGDYDNIAATGRGFGRRAMNNVVPFINTALSGDTLVSPKPYRNLLTQGCTDVLSNMGTNDVKNGGTLAGIQTSMLSAWATHGIFGARVWQTTITPYTSSTDNWATEANQSTRPVEAVRVGLNGWIRDGAPISAGVAVAVGAAGLRAGQSGHPLAGYFDTADAVETARNSGKWKVGMVYLADGQGLHPNSAGSAAMANKVDINRFKG